MDVFPVFKMYLTKESIPALRELHAELDKSGVSILEATMRWLKHHSALEHNDAFIIGASKPEQLDKSLSFTEQGPLDESLVTAYENLWKAFAATAPPSSM